jgi:hypothetical protein
MRELAQAQARRRVEFKAAVDWYDTECATRVSATEDARDAVEEAAAAARAAGEAVRRTDAEVAAAWASTARHLGRHARRFMGPVPEPMETAADAGDDSAAAVSADPARYLRRAESLLDEARMPHALPGWGYPLLVAIGAVCAVLGYITAQSLLALGGPFGSGWGGVVTMAGYVLKLGSPLAGLPVARLLCDRVGAQFHAGVISTTVVGGMVAVTCLMIATG